MEGIVKSVYKVRHRHVKCGWLGALKDFFKGDIVGYETPQEQQTEREAQLTAALADCTVLNTYIGENFADFLNGVGIRCMKVPTLKQLESQQQN